MTRLLRTTGTKGGSRNSTAGSAPRFFSWEMRALSFPPNIGVTTFIFSMLVERREASADEYTESESELTVMILLNGLASSEV
jgi:hypothetical protein